MSAAVASQPLTNCFRLRLRVADLPIAFGCRGVLPAHQLLSTAVACHRITNGCCRDAFVCVGRTMGAALSVSWCDIAASG